MQNQAPLSPARVLYEELRESEDAGLLDTWPAPREAEEAAPAPAPDNALPGLENTLEPAPPVATRCSPATDSGDNGRIDKIDRIHPISGISNGDSPQSQSALAAIIRLQSTEIERLTLDNERLVERMDAVNQLIEDEQNRRRNLQEQLREAELRSAPPAPTVDVEEIRRAAREGMSAEIKPVLTAILDLLEAALPRSIETMNPTAVPKDTPVSIPANFVAEAIADFQQLPEILIRPIDELMSGSGGTDADRVVDSPEQVSPLDTLVREPRPFRHRQKSNAMPSVFAWTSLFS
jgi:hypothetical protein